MEKEINALVENIKKSIISDLKAYPFKNQDVLEMVLAAYNTYQEEERDGVDYIFDIDNTEDLKCCVDGGQTAQEVCELWHNSQMNTTKYFYFGCNHQKPEPIRNYAELVGNLIHWLDEVLPCVIAYPFVYRVLYEHYVTNRIHHVTLSDIEALAELRRKLEEWG